MMRKRQSLLPLESEFVELRDRWEEETSYISSITDVVENENYQRIINCGYAMVPLILRDLEQFNRPHWYTALRELIGDGPMIPLECAGRVYDMNDIWLRWSKAHGHFPAPVDLPKSKY